MFAYGAAERGPPRPIRDPARRYDCAVNSVHDLGGMHGFGAVEHAEEPIFHADWERRAFANHLVLAFQGLYGPLDAARHAVERMGNERYLTSNYYEKWLDAAERLLVERGVLGAQELAERRAALERDAERFARPASAGPDELAETVAAIIRGGDSPRREAAAPPRFAVGDPVVTRRRSPRGHTRLPRYARGAGGRIVGHHGAHVLPDTNAHGLGECPEHLYTVRFEAAELWGDAADGPGAVHLDLWESYLAAAGEERR